VIAADATHSPTADFTQSGTGLRFAAPFCTGALP
jgi:hypothetical protein